MTRASADGREVLDRPRGDGQHYHEDRSVLVVEDEADLRYGIVDFLDNAGYRTLEAANADEALVLLKRNSVRTLFTDIDMPGSTDGLGLVAQVRTLWPTTRVIVTSGLVKLSHRDVDAGVTFVSKPTAGPELLKLMA